MKANVGKRTEGGVIFVGAVVVGNEGGIRIGGMNRVLLAVDLFWGGVAHGIIERIAAKTAEAIHAPTASAKFGGRSAKASQTPRQRGSPGCFRL